MAELYNKDGSPIEYLKNTYNPVTQENEETEQEGNFYDINAPLDDSRTRQLENTANTTINPEDWDEEYDKGAGIIQSFEDIERNRIEAQTTAQRATRAVLGGLVGGIGTAMKDMGYMVSPTAYTNMFEWHDIDNSNIFTRAMVGAGNWLEQGSEKWAPIYEDMSDDSITGQVFKWGTLKGVINSSLGFMIPGAMPYKLGTLALKTAAGVGKVGRAMATTQKMVGAAKAARNLERAGSYKKLFELLHPKAAQRIKTSGALMMSTAGEATWEAIDAHDAELDKFTTALTMGEVEGRHVFELADNAASKTFAINMAKGVLNYTMLDNFTSKTAPKAFRKAGSQWLERHLKEAPQEALEEMTQNVGKSESSYRAMQDFAKKYGEDSAIIQELKAQGEYGNEDVSSKFFERIGQFYTSNEVIVDGIIGAVSGPVQSTMGNIMRGDITPGARFRKENKEYKDQQKEIVSRRESLNNEAGMNAKFKKAADGGRVTGKGAASTEVPTAPAKPAGGGRQSRKAGSSTQGVTENLERAAIAKEVEKLAKDSPELLEIAKEQVFSAVISEAVAKGTFDALKKDAAEMRDAGGVSKDLHKYIEKTETRLKKAEGKLNQAEILLNVQKSDGYESYLSALTSQLAEAETIVADKTAKGLPITPEEVSYAKDIQKTIGGVKQKLADLSQEFTEITSNKRQKEIFKNRLLNTEALAMAEELKKVSTIEDLNFLEKLNPRIAKTVEYSQAKLRLRTANGQANVTDTNTTTDNSQPTANGKTSGVQPISNLDAVIDEQFEDLSTLEKQSLKERLDAKSKYLLEQPGMTEEKFKDAMVAAVIEEKTTIEKRKFAESDEGKQVAKEVKARQRRLEIFGDEEAKLPEDVLEAAREIVAEQEKLNAELVAIGEREAKDEGTKEDAARAKEIAKELSDYASALSSMVQEFNKAAGTEARMNKENPNSTTKGEVWGNKIKKNFTSFIGYIRNIAGEQFVKDNYGMLRNIFKGYPGNKKASVPPTYAAMNRTAVHSEPGQGLLVGTNEEVLNALDKAREARNLANKKSDKRIIFNINPVNSMAHLTESYQETLDENGDPVFVPDDSAQFNVSPLLDPGKYDEGTPLDFSINWDYGKGTTNNKVALTDRNGKVVLAEWSVVKAFLFGDTAGGKIPVVSPEGVAELEKLFNVSIDNVYDVIPVQITGVNEEHLAHMHTPAYITSKNTEASEVSKTQARMRLERATVLDKLFKGEQVTGKVGKKVIERSQDGFFYKGFRMNYSDDWASTAEVIPEDTIMGVIKANAIGTNGKVGPSDILNYDAAIKRLEGAPVVLVPIGRVNGVMKYHAEVLYSEHVAKEHGDTVSAIMEAFVTGATDTDIYRAYAKYGIHINSKKGAIKALSSIVHVTEETDREGESISFERVLANTNGSTGKITVRTNAEGKNEIAFGTKTATIVTADTFVGDNAENIKAELASLFANNKFLYNTSLSLLKIDAGSKKGRVPEVSIQEGVVKVAEKPLEYQSTVKRRTSTRLRGAQVNNSNTRVYTLQNIVEFTLTDGVPSENIYIEDEIADTTEEVQAPTALTPAAQRAKGIAEKLLADTKKVQVMDADGNIVPYEEGANYEFYYINGEKYARLTSYIRKEGEPEIDTEDETSFVPAALRIGSKVDKLTRDIFVGKEIKPEDYDLMGPDASETLEDFVAAVKESQIYKDIQSGKLHLAPDGIVLYDEASKVAGTVDLLVYDNDGVFHIFDMKTMRATKFGDDQTNTKHNSGASKGKIKYSHPYNKGGSSNKDKHSDQLNGYSIMLQNTYGATVGRLAVLPIGVLYSPGDSHTKRLEWRPEIPHARKDTVKSMRVEEGINEEAPVEISDVSDDTGTIQEAMGFPSLDWADSDVIGLTLGLSEMEAAEVYMAMQSGDKAYITEKLQSLAYFKERHTLKDNLPFFAGLPTEAQKQLNNAYLSTSEVTLNVIQEEWALNEGNIAEVTEFVTDMAEDSSRASRTITTTKKC